MLGAETRKEMEDWCQALKMAASTRDFFDPAPPDQHDFLSGHHHWYATSHARPTYCNVRRANVMQVGQFVNIFIGRCAVIPSRV